MSIEVLKISSAYAGHQVLRDITFELCPGEVLAILGANGAGKTTLIDCIVGHQSISSGETRIDGATAGEFSRKDFAKRVAYVPQFHQPVFPYSVLQYVTMGRAAHLHSYQTPSREDVDIARMCMHRLGIENLREKSYTEISGGERQLAMIAQALCQEPNYLMLDEPTSHLDLGNQMKVLRLVQDLANSGFGVLLSCHNPDHSLMFHHRVAILHDSSFIAVGAASDVITKERVQAVYDLEVLITELNCFSDSTVSRMVCVPI